MSPVRPLAPEALCVRCDATRFPFATTHDLPDLLEPVGQSRAAEGLRFGLGIDREGYHLFAMGPVETGKRTLVADYLEKRASGEPIPPDLLYVHDFAQPHRPRALRMPPGRGDAFRKDLDALLEDLRAAIPAALESDEQRTRRQVIEEEVKERQEKAFTDLKKRAEERGIAFLHTPLGFAFAPTKDGEVLTPDQFEALPQEERTRIEQVVEGLQESLKDLLGQVHAWEKDARTRVKALLRELTTAVVGRQIEELKARYAGLPDVLAHLDALQQDVLEHVGDFLKPQAGPPAALGGGESDGGPPGLSPMRRYLANVLVRNGERPGAPVVYEENPTYENLLGRVEHVAQMGTLLTDFLLVKSGALHRANGGYLVLEAHRLLTNPFAWEALKRALQTGEIRIESLGQRLGLVSTVSLEPQPVPLEVKVVVLGERMLYYLLDALDPEFRPLFKVAVDFEEDVARGEEGDLLYARLIATAVRREGLLPFDRGAVARVLERSSRMAGDAEKLSTHMGTIVDLLREADWWARDAGRPVVEAGDVQRAVEAAERRLGRVRERMVEEIRRGTVLIETEGVRVGQVNGLSVIQMGRFAFGRPSRITAKVRLGAGKVVDIEREVELGGPLHSKGVLILSGLLGSRYATDHPLSLGATLVFEQSYGPVEGDSASCAELCALLSALAEVPIRQSVAITGSVDQHGQVQPIGGANEKVEGFYDVCVAKGLTGEQGVVVPASNVKHLMLRPDVVEAVREGKFRVWAVRSVDEALEILTGLAAGERDPSGAYPPDSVNGRVEARLVALARRRMELGRAERGEGLSGDAAPGTPAS